MKTVELFAGTYSFSFCFPDSLSSSSIFVFNLICHLWSHINFSIEIYKCFY